MANSFLTRLGAVTLAASVLIAVWNYTRPNGSEASDPNRPPPPTLSNTPPRVIEARGDLAADEQTTIQLFERSRDAVVFISTSQRVRDAWTRNVMSVPRGTGSGFIWDQDGHVVTNYHVIQGASEATVRLADGRDYRASLVGASPSHDIAVLRIAVDFQRPQPVPLGQSANLKVGQKVFAIGNPFGLDWTLTTGVVSALDRSLPGDSGIAIEHLIQTDAAINPGNSGGPLLDSAGRLIGINAAIYSPSGASAGIGFAIPVDTVNRVVPQILTHGRYLQPAIGVQLDDGWNQRLSRMFKVQGVFVLKTLPGSTAERAGLRDIRITDDGQITPGDIITAVEGKAVTTVMGLVHRLDDFQIGQTVKLTVLREGRTIEVSVQLQEAKS